MHSAHSELVSCDVSFLFNMAESCSRPCTYEKITDEQRKILSNYYDNGMNTTGSNMQNVIEEVATKAKLDIGRVKVRSITRSAEHNLHFTRHFVLSIYYLKGDI